MSDDGAWQKRRRSTFGATYQLKRGLAIDARTADCHWRGERMDYDTAG